MNRIKTALAALAAALCLSFAPLALADAALDPIDYITHDESWVIYFVIAVGAIALAVLIFTIIKIRRNRK